MTAIGNLITEGHLDAMKHRGWIESAREPRPTEGRILVTLWHPRIWLRAVFGANSHAVCAVAGSPLRHGVRVR